MNFHKTVLKKKKAQGRFPKKKESLMIQVQIERLFFRVRFVLIQPQSSLESATASDSLSLLILLFYLCN